MSKIRFRHNIEDFNRGLDALEKELVKELARTLYLGTEQIMADSKANYVPVDMGTLRSSGYVSKPALDGMGTRIVLTAGYGGPAAPYALAVHENPRAGKTGGVSPSGHKYSSWSKVGGWKYLQLPVDKWRPKLHKALATVAAKVLKRGAP